MKMTRTHLVSWALAAVCLNVAGIAPVSTQRDDSQPADKAGQNESLPNDDSPAKFNRASNLIGLKVYNQKEEHLGKVKDIVFDLKNDRVAYVVMAVNTMGLRAFTEKLLAVPMDALSASPDNTHLVLRAEKEKIDLAAGFDPRNWPSATSAAWGAQPFLEKDREQSDGDNNEPTPKPEATPDGNKATPDDNK